MSNQVTKLLSIFFLLITVSACDQQSRGFALPEGDAQVGRVNFIALGCNHCHFIVDDVEKSADGHTEINFELGGLTSRITTYGDLVTSIINPTHKISGFRKSTVNTDSQGQSRMEIYNEVLTVQELIDLTTYLESSYQVVRPQYTPHYYGP